MNKEQIIEKYADAIAYVSEHNKHEDWQPDNYVAYEMLVSNATRGGNYVAPEDFDYDAFREDLGV